MLYGLDEAMGPKMHRKTLVPCSMGLTKTVEIFVEEAYVVRMGTVLESGGLFAVDSLIELVVQECVADV
jgi:hypothetical protein